MLGPNMLGPIDHIGIVVHSIDEAIQTYCHHLGFTLAERMTVADQQVEVAFLNNGVDALEFIAPTDPASGVARFLENRGEGTHHICFQVEDIVATLAQLKEKGMRLIDEAPRPGVHGQIAFVHPKSAHGTMIELLQK